MVTMIANAFADWQLILGSRGPTDVLAQHASLEDTNESTAGVRKT